MYEMEEASPGLAAPAQPVTRLARRDVRPPVPRTRRSCRFPGSPCVPE